MKNGSQKIIEYADMAIGWCDEHIKQGQLEYNSMKQCLALIKHLASSPSLPKSEQQQTDSLGVDEAKVELKKLCVKWAYNQDEHYAENYKAIEDFVIGLQSTQPTSEALKGEAIKIETTNG